MNQEILSVEQMYRADALALAAGIAGARLMEAAGWAVARAARRLLPKGRIAILCGPGNNGGDGFVAARLLARDGWSVRVALLGAVERLKGDAAIMAGRWTGRVEPLTPDALHGCVGVIDALFGAGLARPLEGAAKAVVEEIGRLRLPVIAVDVPSGVHGDSGAVLGLAPDCLATVTFFRPKPGHCLLPGRLKCGELVVADIGIPAAVLDEIAPDLCRNGPGVWALPEIKAEGHKYSRGHVLILGGAEMTGAARLAARAARRVGAGLVSIAAPPEALGVYRAGDPGVLVASSEPFADLLEDGRRNALLLGPGGGVGEALAGKVLAALGTGRPCVLDADALSSFEGRSADLFRHLSDRVVLTPHDGEFRRLFGEMPGSRLERARHAARLSGAIVLLKGADTVVAHPKGGATITTDAPPWLATAGSGDVLAGLLAGLLAQGMEPFEAACAAVWLHGRAAAEFGPGLIAEDLSEAIPAILAERRWDPHD
ncbi:bifunctional ADP-dependent NAD(P)H-hydrate dehydratase/NAD(P)H-hydrate epimerase [Paramagnetospirillum magnetotacticum]|nr:bifunctional ADP-dependent NAD(P)H-hydrate dehydratase/NAD(P)H-hydrate epimerase [Paramagnetospirillum magnetotacticum]